MDFNGDPDNLQVSDKNLIRLLRNSPTRRIPEVTVDKVNYLSPEQAELLTSIIGKAEKLSIASWESDIAYSCMVSCLPQSNGPKEIDFYQTTNISIDQARVLFEAVASSPCLEVLCMRGLNFEPDITENNYESVCEAFLDALQRNRSLKKLLLEISPFGDFVWFPRIFKALTKIESLWMYSDHHGPFHFSSNLLVDALCHDDCSLKELRLFDIMFFQAEIFELISTDQASPVGFNKSVETLSVMSSNFNLSEFMKVAGILHSLVTLELPVCDIPDLSPLYPLLIGDNGLTLRRLQLHGNEITELNAIDFFSKLPQMTCLRQLELGEGLFLSSRRWLTVFLHAIQRNKSLEEFEVDQIGDTAGMDEQEITTACSELDVALRNNRERRLTMEFLDLARSKVFPEKLWPLVLEQARKINPSFWNTRDQRRTNQACESLKAELVYHLLKVKMEHEHLY